VQQNACVGGRGLTEVLQVDHIHLADSAHAVARNSSGTRPESLEVVEADSDRKSNFSHAARPTSAQYVRGAGSVAASGDMADVGVVFETDGERGEHTLLSASAKAGVSSVGSDS
jgi:hypothetical protein